MMIRSTMLLATLGVLALGDARADAEQPAPMPVPAIHLSWNAPWKEPGASTNRRPNCSDYTTDTDTLYLTFQTPRRVVPLLGVSAVLLFEPVAGDTLGPYWDLER